MCKEDGFKFASLNAQKTMALLEDRNIRKVPQNYMIWYEYLSETNPEIREAVNRLMLQKGKFSDEVAKQIYDEFFSHTKEGNTIRETNRLVQQSMEAVLREIRSSSTGLTDYGDRLENFADTAEDLSALDFQKMTRNILFETREMAVRSESLNANLTKASSEIEDLKRRLVDVEQESLTDTLTGIANRKKFDKELARATQDSIQSNNKLCLVMSDIDFFKNFNDTHGHVFGDQVLKLVANTLNEGAGENAVAARYGGEEFGIILPNTTIENAYNLADRLRKNVSSKRLVKRSTGDEVGKITMSFGVAQFDLSEDPLALIARADDALYDAKESGRNQVKMDTQQVAQMA
ncbi:MAG: GGDEF domain-containing protein [Sneathiella sp.]